MMSVIRDDLKSLMAGPPALTLAVAESVTCGHVQSQIGSISGASSFFRGGLTAYSLEQKVQLLAVDRRAAVAVNAVSEGVAQQMARGAIRLFDSDLAIAITGYAEDPPDAPGSAPFAWWALTHREAGEAWREKSGRLEASGPRGRTNVQHEFAVALIEQLVDHLRLWRRGSASRP